MAIRTNRVFNDPGIAQAASNLASLFAPPSGADAAGWSVANAKNAEAKRLSDAYLKIIDPSLSHEMVDRYSIGAGLAVPTQTYYAVDQGNATTRRGQDRSFDASRLNNTDDNARALEERRMQEAGSLARQFAQPVLVNKDQTAFLPGQTAAATGLGAMLSGNIGASPGETIFTPGGQTLRGEPKPLSETEIKAAILGGLPAADQRAATLGSVPLVQTRGPNGEPIYTRGVDAAGQQAYVAPSSVKQTNGLAILPDGSRVPAIQSPDGRWVAAQTGAPLPADVQITDMPKPQGSMRDIGASDTTIKDARNDITSQDIDRAIKVALDNPDWTTSFLGNALSGVAGTPAHDLSSLVDTVKANIGFDQLQAMRNASPTGGALGQVSDTENKLLQGVLGSLSTSQSPAQFVYNMKRLKNVYLDIVHGKGNGPQRYDLGDGTANDPGTEAAPVGDVQRGPANNVSTMPPANGVRIDPQSGALTKGPPSPPAPPAPPAPPGPPGPPSGGDAMNDAPPPWQPEFGGTAESWPQLWRYIDPASRRLFVNPTWTAP